MFVLAEIREAFKVLDRDGNGFISKQELGMAMRSLGYMPSEVELAIIMQRLDMDGKSWCKKTCPRMGNSLSLYNFNIYNAFVTFVFTRC